MSVYKRKYKYNGRNHETSAWWCSYYIDGKRHRESTGEASKRKAEKWERERIVARTGSGFNPDADDARFCDLAQLVKDHYRRERNRSTDRMELSLVHLAGTFADYPLKHITKTAISNFVESRLGEGAKPATVNRDLAQLRLGLNLAQEEGLVQNPPKVKLMKERNTRTGFVDRPEMDTLLRLLPAYLKPLTLAAYWLGWRMRELLSREWQHVDLEGGWLRLEPGETKNGKGRAFPLNEVPELREMLEAQHAKRREIEKAGGRIVRHIFFHHDGARAGQPIRDFRGSWKKATKAAGLEGLLFHDLRRSAARNLVRAGIPESVAMKLIGHETRSIFDRYCIVDETMLREQAAKYGKAAHGGRRKIAGRIGA